jgi:hypothetical protein
MTFKTFLIIKAAVCLCIGPLMLVVPRGVLSMLGTSLTAGGTFAARAYGAALVGTLTLTWFARNVVEWEARRAILLDLLVYDGIGYVVTLLVVLAGILNPLGWGIVVVYLFFTVGSAYLLVAERDSRRAAAARG